MAKYNKWLNDKVILSINNLNDDELNKDMGAFFNSILGTLNHLIIADYMWLKRFTEFDKKSCCQRLELIKAPTSLNDVLYDNKQDYIKARNLLDDIIIDFINNLEGEDYSKPLTYSRANGETYTKEFGGILSHFFNHQTHHRGQVTTLLSQLGIDIGATDLHLLLNNYY